MIQDQLDQRHGVLLLHRRTPAGSSPRSSRGYTPSSRSPHVVGQRRAGLAVRSPLMLDREGRRARDRLLRGCRDLQSRTRPSACPGTPLTRTAPADRPPARRLLVIIFLVVLTYLAKRTMFGRHVYAVGGNAEAARRAGINVARIRILVFMISGAMAGVGGIILAANVNSVVPQRRRRHAAPERDRGGRHRRGEPFRRPGRGAWGAPRLACHRHRCPTG